MQLQTMHGAVLQVHVTLLPYLPILEPRMSVCFSTKKNQYYDVIQFHWTKNQNK